MLKNVILLFILAALCSACDSTWQYGVYVKNDTGEDMKIAFKSDVDREGPVEKTIVLKDGQSQLIINTIDLPVEGTWKDNKALIADYVKAYIRDTIPSKIQWTDQKVQAEVMDIQQAEYSIHYTINDF